MYVKLSRIFYPLAAFVTLAALACDGSGGSPATPTLPPPPSPTQPPPTKAPLVSPTKPPIAGPAEPAATEPPPPVDEAPFTLSPQRYQHPSGMFSLNLPEGWTITEYDTSVTVASPDDAAAIDVYFENLGVEYDPAAFANYYEAFETNWYATFRGYDRQPDEPLDQGGMLVLKSLETDQGAMTVGTYYWQLGSLIMIEDVWTAPDLYDAYSQPVADMFGTVEYDPDKVAEAAFYPLRYAFTCPGDLCTFNVPFGWAHEQHTGEGTVSDLFTSPDKQTFVEHIVYDSGQSVSRSQAGAVALYLLNQFYAKDVKVTADKFVDGREWLVWTSKSGGYSGIAFFETRGTTFLMLTWVASDSLYQLYLPIWSDLLSTYKIP